MKETGPVGTPLRAPDAFAAEAIDAALWPDVGPLLPAAAERTAIDVSDR